MNTSHLIIILNTRISCKDSLLKHVRNRMQELRDKGIPHDDSDYIELRFAIVRLDAMKHAIRGVLTEIYALM